MGSLDKRFLLDTHALPWWILDDSKLSQSGHSAIRDPENLILVSAASAWEIATKFRQGKLHSVDNLVADFSENLRQLGLIELSVTVEEAVRSGLLPEHHKDPFDRMLAAQCQIENLPIISNDKIFDLYGVNRVW